MIIGRSPLRITLGGGGTDLPSYYRDHEGFLISAAIDKYVYVTMMRPFTPGIYLKYSQLEHVEHVDNVQHPIIREAIQIMNFNTPQIEITTLADIPAGTDLGSSGSFTTALLKALYAHHKRLLHPEELAKLACHIEIDRLGEPIGKQDQYIAAYGGITCFTFHKDDSVHALEEGNANLFGELMDEHWEHKKRRSGGISNPHIDEWYDLGKKNGAVGGKLVGAGGGGFLMFYASDRNKLRHTMAKAGLEEVRFRFDFEGTKLILS